MAPDRSTRSAFLSLMLGLASPAALAEDIRVSKTGDSDDGVCNADCSLREAIAYAAAQPGGHRIQLAEGRYVLDPGGAARAGADDGLVVSGELTLVGAGAGKTLLDGGRHGRLFSVSEGARLHLEQLSLRNGRSATRGGALLNEGETTLEHVELRDNQVYAIDPGPDHGWGGAIANYGWLDIRSSHLVDNQAFSETTDEVRGGGLYNAGQLRMRNSTLEHNNSSNGVDNGFGGGLYNQGFADIARSTLVRNSQGEGGLGAAILNTGVLRLVNSTLSNNPTYFGRGVLVNGRPQGQGGEGAQALLGNVTIAGNGNYGLMNFASMAVRNSLVAGNRHINDDSEVFVRNCLNQGRSFDVRGLMLGRDGHGCSADLPLDDALTFTRVLEPLSAAPGSPPLHPLRAGSPAIDAGVGTCTASDQRKVLRPQDGNGDGVAGCDLGAYERAAP
ncbi:CSLREA domain-containing protein [Pseudomonas tohonis]|uniref:CSLREA domain-containing protein n=1 Tax=Pseudomonas tohonis TaxID=2725477 RepID=UPI0022F002A0|nr:CSLREA domain-containing protein [Pseudomonas tohonis]